jgi:PAS domain S-box-containing protein
MKRQKTKTLRKKSRDSSASTRARIGELQQRIARQREAEDALLESQRSFFTLISNLPGMAYRLRNDEGRSVEFASEGCRTLTGYSNLDLLEKHSAYMQLVHPDDRDMLARAIQEALAQKQYFKATYRIVTADGKQKWAWEQGCGVAAPDREEMCFTEGFVADITELKEKEQELRLAYERLKETQNQLIQAEKMRVIGTLASGVAHEVKNPLAIMLQGIDYITQNLPAHANDIPMVLSYMSDAVARADTIVKGLLDFSRVSTVEIKDEALHPLLEKALLLVKSDCERGDVKVVKKFAREDIRVKLDKNKMEQVFINIFMNAVHAMPQGGELRVVTGLEKSPDGARQCAIEVYDTGTGIPKDIIEKIFEPFVTTKQDRGGTGLGLSIVKNIIEMHQGAIVFANRSDTHGVKVTITLKA